LDEKIFKKCNLYELLKVLFLSEIFFITNKNKEFKNINTEISVIFVQTILIGGNFMKYLVPVARVLFSAIFFSASFSHFSSGTVAYAQSQGVPFAAFLVPASGVLALLGALSVMVGFKAKLGALALVAFLVPVTIMMHNFWTVSDPMMKQMQMIMFMKNISMLGGAILIAYFGAGPVSIDNKNKK
jgi:putative oxidoreductase